MLIFAVLVRSIDLPEALYIGSSAKKAYEKASREICNCIEVWKDGENKPKHVYDLTTMDDAVLETFKKKYIKEGNR